MLSGETKYWNEQLEKMLDKVRESVKVEGTVKAVVPAYHDEDTHKWHQVLDKMRNDAC